jgi:ribonuclease P protein component
MPGRRRPLPPRLTRRAEFLRAAAKGRKAGRPGVLVQALRDQAAGDAPLRVGFTATKKLGGAVVRNRAKRRLREAVRLTLGGAPLPGWQLVLVARDATATRPFPALLGDLRGALRQAGVLDKAPPPPPRKGGGA